MKTLCTAPDPSSAGRPAAASKSGQSLKRKGLETRQRLMDAALRLLETCSPLDLTAIAITKEARAAATTFYFYFDDVPDILFVISQTATAEMMAAIANTDLFNDPKAIASDSVAFIEMFNHVWDRHSAIFLYRNMEADRGNPRFLALRAESAKAVLDRLYRLFRAARSGTGSLSDEDAYADAVVILTAIEQLAGVPYRYPNSGIEPARLRAAQARMLAKMLEPSRA